MAYMCLGCYEVYDRDLGYCPKANCNCVVAEIDELMLPAIKMLNQKGYMTQFCCSGHVYDDGCTAYVVLDDYMTNILEEDEIEYIKSILPESWKMEIDRSGRIHFQYMLNKDYEYKLYVETYEDILKANVDFLHFVQQLPELSKMIEVLL